MKGFLQGNLRSFTSKIKFLAPSKHVIEQAYWRLGEVAKNSPECLEKKQCIHCGCSIEEKVLEDRGCEEECYPYMMNSLLWEIYKIDHNIIVNVRD